jgi:hypothetical protein
MASLSSINPTISPVYPAFDTSQKDKFGLSRVWIIAEPPSERKARKAAARQLARDAFESVATHLGHDEARRLFAELARKPPKGKQADRRKNKMILDCYDVAMNELGNPDGSLPGYVAGLLKSNSPDFRSATEATEKRIRRLLKERDARQAKEKSPILVSQTIVGGSVRDK